jgi:hypothetical protein
MLISQSHIDLLVRDIQDNYPEFLRAKDLIESGLYQTRSDLSWAMKRDQAPPAIRLSSHKIIFPRSCLCKWLTEKALVCCVEGESSDNN